MLSSLPIELLREVIESSVPHAFHPRTYKQRQRTLRSLSLVCRQFRQIAQPLLFEIVWIETRPQCSSFEALAKNEASKDHLGKYVRCLRLGDGHSAALPFDRAFFEQLLPLLPLVRNVALLSGYGYVIEPVDIFVLDTLPALSDLHLGGSCSVGIRASVLTNLQSLTLYCVTSDLLRKFLTPIALPNLRVFALVDVHPAAFEWITHSAFDQLLPQLETLHFDFDIWELPKAKFLHSAADRTLIDFTYSPVVAVEPENRVVNARLCRTYDGSQSSSTHLLRIFNDLTSSFSLSPSAPLPLRLLYLDSSLQPQSSLPLSLRRAVDLLIIVCQDHKIEIVFELVPDNFDVDPYISPDFARRQKERREKGRLDH